MKTGTLKPYPLVYNAAEAEEAIILIRLARTNSRRDGIEEAARILEKAEEGQRRHNNKRAKWVTEACKLLRAAK